VSAGSRVMAPDAGRRRVLVVGAGVGGLVAAYRLVRDAGRHVDVVLLEASRRVGGKLRAIGVGDLVVEAGADSFVARKPWAVALCEELGLGRELVAPASSGAYLWTAGGLVPFPKDAAFGIPSDLGDVLRWPGLSGRGRARAAQDLVRRPRRGSGDESLGALLRRRLGDEATDLAVGPLLGGLFAGDVDRLSVLSTFPELAAWERRQGSLIRGSQAARRASGGDRKPMFLRPAGGVSRLADALVEAIGGDRILLDRPATALRRASDRWVVATPEGALDVDAVVLATPAFESARLLRPVAGRSAAELDRISYASTGTVVLVYGDGTSGLLPRGTGFVVPSGRAPMTACTWLSNKWPSEAYGSRAVVRCYVGGVGSEDVVDEPEDEIVSALTRHLAALLPLPATVEASAMYRWRRAMPQYEVGHLERVAAILRGLPDGIFLTGSSVGGAGIADCVRHAGEAAQAVRTRVAGLRAEKETVP
jgi:protoporphyrinogen/coproporphyrinogen III oxidase